MAKKSLKLLSWNVHFHSFYEDSSYVVEVLSQHKPDVVCLQEYVSGGDNKLDLWLDANGYDLEFFAHRKLHEVNSAMQMGLAVAYKRTLSATVSKTVLRSDGPSTRWPYVHVRGVIELSLKIDGKQMSLLNHHSSPARPATIDMRKREFEGLIKYVDEQVSGVPFILCGDFNFIGYDRRRNYFIKMYGSFSGGLFGKTWLHNAKLSPLRANLDYLFWTKDKVKLSAELLDFSVSDHRPILAHVKLT